MNPRAWAGVLSLLAALGGPALGQLPDAGAAGPRPGWQRMAKSLLYFDSDGNLANEIGLGRWEEASGARVRTKAIEAGISSDGRFAWTLDRRATWNSLKTKVLEEHRVLRFFDPDGKELWSEEGADSPPGGAPLVFSADGRSCLLALRRPSGWWAAAKTYLGNTLWEAGPFPKLELLQLSPSGRYGLARWNEPDKSAAHSFLDIEKKTRRDVPSDRFLLGKTAIDDQGRAFSGSTLVFSFSASTAAAPGARP